jgi:2-methylcitrate dehydratase PrpD
LEHGTKICPTTRFLQAKTFILDTIGVGIAGSSAAGADELSQVSAGWGEGAEACVWGRRKRVPAPTAALNGFQVHCREYFPRCRRASRDQQDRAYG